MILAKDQNKLGLGFQLTSISQKSTESTTGQLAILPWNQVAGSFSTELDPFAARIFKLEFQPVPFASKSRPVGQHCGEALVLFRINTLNTLSVKIVGFKLLQIF